MQYRLDLFSVFIFLGIVQAIFLCVFFFSRENRKISTNVFQGLLLIAMALNNLEIFLMYSGYIKDCLFLVDFSEPVAFCLGPLFYLMTVSMVRGSVGKWWFLHFLFPVVYTLTLIPFFLEPDVVKYNSWINSYHPDLPLMPYEYADDPRVFWITNQHTLLTILSLVVYGVLTVIFTISTFISSRESFWRPATPVLLALRNGFVQLLVVLFLVLAIKFFFEYDTGDHFIAAYISVVIYLMSIRVISHSGFFKQPALAEVTERREYEISSHKPLLDKLHHFMQTERPYLHDNFSLPDLAERLGSSVHALSRAMNEGLGKSFFEMTAEYRVNEAKRLLKEKANIKVEEIAEQVGYSSKSSFNTAFKKITGITPSEFRAGQS